MSDFSSNLRRLRKRAGLSQDALAEKLSVARQNRFKLGARQFLPGP